MKLNEAIKVNSINDEYITLINSEGHPLRISKADLTEIIRDNMPVATQAQKGLLDAGSDRFVKAKGLSISAESACIKLYSAIGRTAVTAIVTTGRIEGKTCGVFLLSFSMASNGYYYGFVKKLNNSGADATFYYVKDGNQVSIYMVSSVDYSLTHVSPLMEFGNYSYHLKQEPLSEGAVRIDVE